MKVKIKKSTTWHDGWYIHLMEVEEWLLSNGHWGREFNVSVDDGIIYIEKPSIDFRGETRKYTKLSKYYRFYFTSSNISAGDYSVKYDSEECLKIEKV